MFKFEHTWAINLLGILPLMLLVFLWLSYWRKKAMLKFASANLSGLLLADVSRGKRITIFILYLVCVALIVGVISNPQVGTKMEEVKREGIDMVICLDVSNSMMAEDLYPNRLEHAKRAITKLVDNLRDDRIGIVVFGGEAYVQLPVTTDFTAAKLFLESIDTDVVPVQGTNIGAAIETAMQSFDKSSVTGKAIIVITDGENHEEGAMQAAEKAKEKGIRIFTVGMGSANGAPIPVYQNGRQMGYKRDRENNTVITRLNETMLQEIALAGNGTYARASNNQSGLGIILSEINKMDKQSFGSKVYRDYESRFQLLAAPALLLLIAELFISERKSRWWNRLDIFKKEQA